MAVHKVPQDIEADDKLIGWMSLKQFIFGLIAAAGIAIMYFSIVKGVPWLAIPFFPFTALAGVLAAPLGRDQPTEIWLAARIRFFLKPHRRIWDQTGMKQLVHITAPPRNTHNYTDGLNQDQVRSRLEALARTLDSRGWAVKNVNVNLFAQPAFASSMRSPDRLIGPTRYMQAQAQIQAPPPQVSARDDIFDARANPLAHSLDEQLQTSRREAHDRAIERAHFTTQTQQSTPPAAPIDITDPDALDAMTDREADALLERQKQEKARFEEQTPQIQRHTEKKHKDGPERTVQFSHDSTLSAPAEESKTPQAPLKTNSPTAPEHVIVDLAKTDDLSVAAVEQQARRAAQEFQNEVTIKLH